jgi:hemerythrin superfamily protein
MVAACVPARRASTSRPARCIGSSIKEDTMPNRMDHMVSKGAKAAKARVSGLVGVFKVLAEQHGQVAGLLERARTSDDRLTQLWPTIRRELLSHELAEIREVYPVLRMHPDLRDVADHHDREAAEIEQLIGWIQEMAIGSPERHDAYDRLVDAVLRHAREEENTIFPRVQRTIGKQTAQALLPRFLATRTQFLESF